eukprot:scaffold13663_cov78-Skeletonema_dohrnii-CCMP3373.AAC.1
MSKKRGLEDPPGATSAAISSLPRHRQRLRSKRVNNIIRLCLCVAFVFVIHSLFVLEPLARDSVQEPKNNDAPIAIDLPALEERSITAHSSSILFSSHNTSGSELVSTIKIGTSDLFNISNIPTLTETLTKKPSRYTDGLEFIHITKTAGSSIESAAANAGIKYGACHWLKLQFVGFGSACNKPDKKWYSMLKMKLNQTRTYKWNRRMSLEHWHTPWHWFQDDLNPYQNKSFFAVVRNPYERAVSEFFWSCKKQNPGLCNDTTSTTMNQFIQQQSKTCLTRNVRVTSSRNISMSMTWKEIRLLIIYCDLKH